MRTENSMTPMAMRKWRGIIVPLASGRIGVAAQKEGSSRGSEFVAVIGDSGRDGAGHVLLIGREGEVHDVGAGRSDFDRNGGGGHVIQRTQRRGQSARLNLMFAEFEADGLGGGLAVCKRAGLRGVPGDERSVVFSARREQRSVEADAFAAGGG